MDQARRFFRAIETTEGWVCRIGRSVVDSHPTFEEALEHLSELARAAAPSRVFAHYLEGAVVGIAIFD